MRVSIEVSAAMTIASGGLMLSSSYFVIHLVASLNPYHRPATPMIVCLASFLAGLTIATMISDDPPILAARAALAEAVSSILSLLPLAFVFVTYHLIRTSLRRRPEDPLLSLLGGTTSDE
jgi:hypothetical protein